MRCGPVSSVVSDKAQFKDLRTFDPYRTYLSKQDEGQKMFQDVTKKFSGFSSFIDVSEAITITASDSSAAWAIQVSD